MPKSYNNFEYSVEKLSHFRIEEIIAETLDETCNDTMIDTSSIDLAAIENGHNTRCYVYTNTHKIFFNLRAEVTSEGYMLYFSSITTTGRHTPL